LKFSRQSFKIEISRQKNNIMTYHLGSQWKPVYKKKHQAFKLSSFKVENIGICQKVQCCLQNVFSVCSALAVFAIMAFLHKLCRQFDTIHFCDFRIIVCSLFSFLSFLFFFKGTDYDVRSLEITLTFHFYIILRTCPSFAIDLIYWSHTHRTIYPRFVV